MILDIQAIKELIPHRNPFLFIDQCEIKIPGEHGIAYKKFNEDEYFFKGHFPNNPIVPGVIIVEAMAQTAGIVVSYKLKEYTEKSVLFMSVNKAKFRKPIIPNDNVSFEVKFINRVRDVYKFHGICYKDTIKVSESEFSAMITYK
ncbi:MAG: 3-hydroxyacyl-[acyl-carrier-protein] dehydratase FabZ [Actinomycetales bacterium]|nr:MAG: 3-hydroxyacyl-[acyl-carrier-protein] dehydratase FabZ [Actinomycetales bacterium]|tara:strand:- start:1543 stop:1977 length:435 start_codon:yes stop_codon:yes gene_type:complete